MIVMTVLKNARNVNNVLDAKRMIKRNARNVVLTNVRIALNVDNVMNAKLYVQEKTYLK